jgi:hypothetical protein
MSEDTLHHVIRGNVVFSLSLSHASTIVQHRVSWYAALHPGEDQYPIGAYHHC